MPRSLARPFHWSLLVLAFLVGPEPAIARAEAGGPAELEPGMSSERRAVVSTRASRRQALRVLARTQAAELDSLAALAALAAVAPAEAGRWQREIEAVKRRHAREEIVLQQDFARRSGDAALARRLAQRLERLDRVAGGAR